MESPQHALAYEVEIEKGEEEFEALFSADGKLISKEKEAEKAGDD